MDESEHDQDRLLLESIVRSIADQALQLPPNERYAFIRHQADYISLAYSEKYGPPPDPEDCDRKLYEWARDLVNALQEGREGPPHSALSDDDTLPF